MPPSNDRATEAQKDYAVSLGISFAEDISRGEISKLIDAAIQKRRDEIGDLDRRESDASQRMREEILRELNAESPRLCDATPGQMVEELGNRGLAAILVRLPADLLENIDDAVATELQIAFNDEMTEQDMRRVLMIIGASLMRQA